MKENLSCLIIKDESGLLNMAEQNMLYSPLSHADWMRMGIEGRKVIKKQGSS